MYRVLCLLACLTGDLYAAEHVGKVINTNGDVFIIDANDSKRNLFKGDFLYTQDKIQTLNNSFVLFETNNQQSFTLYQNTTLTLNDYRYSPQTPELTTLKFELIDGTLRVNNLSANFKNTNFIKASFFNIETTLADYILEANSQNGLIRVNNGSVRILGDMANTLVSQGQTFEITANNLPKPTIKVISPIPTFENKTIIKEKTNSKDGRPRLENFSHYKDFMQAMYLYKKAEEELRRPKIIIPNLPSGESLPEYSLIDDGYEVTNWAEDLTNLDPNRNMDHIELVKQSSQMTVMNKDEMELSAVKDIFSVTFFSLADFLNMKSEELNRLITLKKSLEDSLEQQNSSDIMAKLLKSNIKTNAVGNDISILDFERDQPDITVIKRP